MPACLEIACFSLEAALAAARAGAHRIEFCSGWQVGGLTPEQADFQALRQQTHLPIYVMVRPHSNGFVYDQATLQAMLEAISSFKRLGADGFVFGVLTPETTVDVAANLHLVQAAAPLPCTFHRAFDEVADPSTALEDVIRCGFRTVLTSGGQATALQGAVLLQKLQQQAAGRIAILPGGGVRAAHLSVLHRQLGAGFYHSSGISAQRVPLPDADEIRQMLAILAVD